MNKTITALVFGVTLALSLPAWAHTDEYFEFVTAPHGGQLRMVGPYHLELVAKEGHLTIYVTDHADNEISVRGGLGKAIIETGQTRTQVNLHPVGDNVLKGSGVFTLAPDTVVIVFMKLPEQDAHSARFMPLKAKNSPDAKTQDGITKTEDHDTPHHHHHPPKH